MSAVVGRFGRGLAELRARRERRAGAEALAVCPTDSWAFRPQYTDGHCPLCGWEPPGTIVRLPLSRRVDTFGWMLIALVAVSIVMLVVVSIAYAHS